MHYVFVITLQAKKSFVSFCQQPLLMFSKKNSIHFHNIKLQGKRSFQTKEVLQ